MLLRFLFLLKIGERRPGLWREKLGNTSRLLFPITFLHRTVSQILICRASEVNLRQNANTVTRGLSEPGSLCQAEKEEQ